MAAQEKIDIFKGFLKKILEKFNIRIINLGAQNRNLEHFSTYNTFKKLIDHFRNEKIIIFDVGAHIGIISKKFLKLFKDMSITDYEIHCFEPNPNIFNELKKIENSKVFVNNIAIGKDVGKNFFYCYANPQLDSFYQRDDAQPVPSTILKEKIEVNVTTIDEYCKNKNINKISFLKIDTEGAEPECLEGTQNLIKQNKVDCVFTELSIGKLYKEIELDISMIEKNLLHKFQMVGIGMNRDFYTEGKFYGFLHSLNSENYMFNKYNGPNGHFLIDFIRAFPSLLQEFQILMAELQRALEGSPGKNGQNYSIEKETEDYSI